MYCWFWSLCCPLLMLFYGGWRYLSNSESRALLLILSSHRSHRPSGFDPSNATPRALLSLWNYVHLPEGFTCSGHICLQPITGTLRSAILWYRCRHVEMFGGCLQYTLFMLNSARTVSQLQWKVVQAFSNVTELNSKCRTPVTAEFWGRALGTSCGERASSPFCDSK